MTNNQQSENINDLITAIITAEQEFGSIEKNCKGNFGKYAGLSEVYDKTKPALQKHGLKIIGTTSYNEDGSNILSQTIYHISGQWIKSSLRLSPSSTKPTDMGTVLTYMRRYLYCTLLSVAADEDVDGDPLNEAAKKKPEGPLNEKEIFELAQVACTSDPELELEQVVAYLLRPNIKSRLLGPLDERIKEFKVNPGLRKAVEDWVTKKNALVSQPQQKQETN